MYEIPQTHSVHYHYQSIVQRMIEEPHQFPFMTIYYTHLYSFILGYQQIWIYSITNILPFFRFLLSLDLLISFYTNLPYYTLLSPSHLLQETFQYSCIILISLYSTILRSNFVVINRSSIKNILSYLILSPKLFKFSYTLGTQPQLCS